MPFMKFNKIFLDEIEGGKINKIMMSLQDKKNCLVICCLSHIFNLSTSIKDSMRFIERCFPMFADSNNFLELGIICVRKILLSSELNIDSELQVFKATDSWLSYDIIQRSKYAKDLLSKIRLPLLSVPALKQVLERVSLKYHEFSKTIEAVLVKKQQLQPLSCNISSRYCNQMNFNVLVCGGQSCDSRNVFSDVKLFNANNFSEVINLPNMKEARHDFGAVCIKDEFYVFGGIDNNRLIRSVEKYSPDTNTWEYVVDVMDDREHFSLFSFKNSLKDKI